MRKMTTTTTTTRVVLFLLAATACFSPSLGGGDTLSPSQSLADDDAGGATLISSGSRFALGFFSPSGTTDRYVGVWYHSISQQTVVWVANRDRPIAGRSGRLSLTPNGTLVIADAVAQNNSTPIVWSSGPPAVPVANPVARLLDDGNLIVAEAGGGDSSSSSSPAWEGFDFPTDTILPGMKVGVNLTTGLNRNITSWRSAGDPSLGDYVSSYDMNGDPQLFLWSGAQKYWRGGPWNGFVFSGLPEMKVDILHYDFVLDPAHRALSYSYRVLDASMLSRFTMTSQGTLQHLLWIEDHKSWMVYGFTPRDECDTISPCGPNGLCYPNRDTITCACVQGFSPKSGSIKDLRDWANGCRRRTPLDCRNGTDGFVKQGNVKLPDTAGATVDWRQSVSLDQCRAGCLKNCSCTAYASANLSTGGSGSGCVMWTSDLTDLRTFDSEIGQDLYIRVAAADLVVEGKQHSRKSQLVAIILAPSLAALLLLVACGICWAWRRKRRTNRGQDNVDEEKEVVDMDLPVYDLAAVVDATNNFSMDNKLGQGGFGPVYKGELEDGREIAVKRLSKTSVQGVEEFKNEVMLIAKLQHRNLVRLFGCCVQGGERMLIYEYMANGSLDSLLFDETKKMLLNWPIRYNIITGIARGLLYLHQDSRFRIIHRDLKAGNILLDKDMSPKISDFGMARIFGGDDTEVNTRKVVGTYGYMSPEYAMDGIFSVKSDVFSFGVLVLEIITGKKNRGLYHTTNHLNLIAQVWNLWKEGKPFELVDKSIRHSLHIVEVLSCIKVGLLCVQERPSDRPTISSVVRLLGNDSAQLPEPKKPGFIASKGMRIDETDSSTSKNDNMSGKDDITLSILEGR